MAPTSSYSRTRSSRRATSFVMPFDCPRLTQAAAGLSSPFRRRRSPSIPRARPGGALGTDHRDDHPRRRPAPAISTLAPQSESTVGRTFQPGLLDWLPTVGLPRKIRDFPKPPPGFRLSAPDILSSTDPRLERGYHRLNDEPHLGPRFHAAPLVNSSKFAHEVPTAAGRSPGRRRLTVLCFPPIEARDPFTSPRKLEQSGSGSPQT